MWIEKQGNKYRACTRYRDPLTDVYHKISVTIDKNTARSRSRARDQLDAMIERRTACAPDVMQLSRLIELYGQYQEQTVKASTVARNQSVCRQFLKIFGDVNVNKLTAGIVKDRLMEYTDNPTTINEYIGRFKALMRFGYQHDFVADVSWLDKLTRLKDRTKREKVVDKFLEREECERLVDAMTGKWKDLTAFLILTGLRIGEALALNEEDVDLKNREISVTKTLNPNDGTITTPKTAASARTIYMQDDLMALSRAVLASNAKKRKNLYMYTSPLFFALTGAHAPYDAYRKYLREVSERVLGRKITPHVLRHTHASLLAEQGVPYDVISRRLGHDGSRITKEIYIHVTERRKEKENALIRGVQLVNF